MHGYKNGKPVSFIIQQQKQGRDNFLLFIPIVGEQYLGKSSLLEAFPLYSSHFEQYKTR